MCYCITDDQKKCSCWLLAVHLTGSAEQGCRPATGYQSWESLNLPRILISCPFSYSQKRDLQMYALQLKCLFTFKESKKERNSYLRYHSSSEHTTVSDGLNFSPALCYLPSPRIWTFFLMINLKVVQIQTTLRDMETLTSEQDALPRIDSLPLACIPVLHC